MGNYETEGQRERHTETETDHRDRERQRRKKPGTRRRRLGDFAIETEIEERKMEHELLWRGEECRTIESSGDGRE